MTPQLGLVPILTLTIMSNRFHDQPLPYGWVQEYDSNANAPFWVDIKANPPRSIWTHPFEDEQYLKEHPEAREKVSSRMGSRASSYTRPGDKSSDEGHHRAGPNTQYKRGLLGKLKDKAIGTKEEREAAKAQAAMIQEQHRQQRMQQLQAMQQQRQQMYGNGSGGMYGNHGGGMYGPPMGQPMYAPQQRRRGGGMGGAALPLAGGLAGGMLLGSMLDGPDIENNYYGDDFGGGGDFDGGDFGGFD